MSQSCFSDQDQCQLCCDGSKWNHPAHITVSSSHSPAYQSWASPGFGMGTPGCLLVSSQRQQSKWLSPCSSYSSASACHLHRLLYSCIHLEANKHLITQLIQRWAPSRAGLSHLPMGWAQQRQQQSWAQGCTSAPSTTPALALHLLQEHWSLLLHIPSSKERETSYICEDSMVDLIVSG